MTGNPWFSSILWSLFFSFIVWVAVGTNTNLRSHGDHRPNFGNAIGLSITNIFTLSGIIRLLFVAALFAVYKACGGPTPFDNLSVSLFRENLMWQPPDQTQKSYLAAAIVLSIIAGICSLISWLRATAKTAGNHPTH